MRNRYDKGCLINELEKDVEYIHRLSHGDLVNTCLRYKLTEEGLFKKGYESIWEPSGKTYNQLLTMRFFKVIKIFTFDQAKADCLKNGTSYYVIFYSDMSSQDLTKVQTMSRNIFGKVIIEVQNTHSVQSKVVLCDGWIRL